MPKRHAVPARLPGSDAWRTRLRKARQRSRQTVLEFTAGGSWTYQLRTEVRRNLRWFWLDGTFASASDSVMAAYLSVFLLALGGTRAQIGLMNSLASFSAALLLFPGAALSLRLGRRKPVVLIGATGARTVMLLLALAPLAFTGQTVVYVVIGLVIIRSASVHLGVPAWSSLMADLVPVSWRGRYFAARSIAMVAAGMVATLAFGQLISRVREPLGYQLAFLVAFALGMVATTWFYRISEPPVAEAPATAARRGRSLRGLVQGNRSFVVFCGVAALWNFSVNLGGPFFSVFLVEGLGAAASLVGTLSVISSLSSLPGHRLFGTLIDRWGPRRIYVLTGLLIPVLAIGWVFAQAPWHVVPLYILGGFLWAGFGVASLNVQLNLMPADRRTQFAALLQVVVLLGLAGGAAVGGIIAERWGYQAVFIATGVGRLLAALLFVRFVTVPAGGAAGGGPGPAELD